ncbi:MAG: thiamine-phosphate kinase [Bacteroidia bacterium]|nr:thiamine-phosphate kinase [Bacteroidia bacterium]
MAGLTSIERLGEFGLIDHLTKRFPLPQAPLLTGIGDDAAVYLPAAGKAQVVTTDLLLEGVHFDLGYTPLRHLGYKAVAVNVSDLAAMNADPVGITVSFGVSSRFSVEALEELYAGIAHACEAYGVQLLGGDTSSSRQGLVLSVTAVGEAHPGQITYRHGARPGDLICVSGDVGAAYAGLMVLEREKAVFKDRPDLQPDLTSYDYVVGRLLRPEARLDIVRLLRELGVQPTAMMDVSDGIASELHHLCRQSSCGAQIYAHKIPIDYQTVAVAEEFKLPPVAFALNGGEDYELIFTVPIGQFDTIKSARDFAVIGHMTPDAGIIQLVSEGGEAVDIEAQGWNHFTSTP